LATFTSMSGRHTTLLRRTRSETSQGVPVAEPPFCLVFDGDESRTICLYSRWRVTRVQTNLLTVVVRISRPSLPIRPTFPFSVYIITYSNARVDAYTLSFLDYFDKYSPEYRERQSVVRRK